MQPITHVDITNFQAEVIEKSNQVTVIVEFWSPTVPQCATLGSQLEQLAIASGGSWVLAKMNVADPQNQQLAMQLHIQGIPAVKAFQNSKLVDEFTGIPPLPQLEAWLERFGPDDTSALVKAAQQAIEDGAFEAASGLLKSLQEIDPEDLRPLVGFAEIAISMEDKDAAISLLKQIPEDKIEIVKGWYSKVELLIESFGKDKSLYEKAIEKDPLDYESRFELAMLNAGAQEYAEAFEHLIHIVAYNPKSSEETKKDEPIRIEEKARLAAIKLFEVVGQDSELAIEWRKKLGRAMY